MGDTINLDPGGHYTLTGDEIEAAMHRADAAEERIALDRRIGNYHTPACAWCGVGVVLPITDGFTPFHEDCLNAVLFITAEDWSPLMHGVRVLYAYTPYGMRRFRSDGTEIFDDAPTYYRED